MIGWVDASAGASGDMLLGAVLDAGVPLSVVATAVEAVAPERVALAVETVSRNGFAATRCHVEVADSRTHRSWADVAVLLRDADLDDAVRSRARATFERLAVAEAAVHGTDPADVHFHEVGALDAVADVVGVCAAIEHLRLDELVVSPVAVGSGAVRASVPAHGELPVPPPAVAELLRGAPSYAGPGQGTHDGTGELCTPTGAALLTTSATSYGAQPAMTVTAIGVGAGTRDPATHANVLRVLVGVPTRSTVRSGGDDGREDSALVLESNIDDLDPRLWPDVIAALLEVGASDAWLTPILMKKGRPAHTLTALVPAARANAVRDEIFRQTSTIGLRQTVVGKVALDRDMRVVHVAGHPVQVKLALHDGRIVNAQPEYDDVVRVAARTGRPAKDVLAEAAAAGRLLRDDRTDPD